MPLWRGVSTPTNGNRLSQGEHGRVPESRNLLRCDRIPASDRKESQNPHPCRLGAAKISAFGYAARMGHPQFIRCWRTAGSSCLASLARRNDKGCEAAIATFYVSTFVDSGVWLILLTWFESGVII